MIGLFLHQSHNAITTLSEIRRVHTEIGSRGQYSLFAYATQSGLASFDLAFGSEFWAQTPTRWLFGIDYGRTQPEAIRTLCERPHSEVRIHDGSWVVEQQGFLPRRDFHLKTTLIRGNEEPSCGAVVGSGNFSSSGLRQNIEAGATLVAREPCRELDVISAMMVSAEELWEAATPAETILDQYAERWTESFSRSADGVPPGQVPGPRSIFWIEAGYVTRNRGPNRPGNQVDLPRGLSRYFGLNAPANLPLNSVIGEITFFTPTGDLVSRHLRLGNNSMEKITLPLPEQHGFELYDGKVLVFRRCNGGFYLNALEAADFEATFGDRLSLVLSMGSGRRYGHINVAGEEHLGG
jgi:hypothetical protein